MRPFLAFPTTSPWFGVSVVISFVGIFTLDILRPLEYQDCALYLVPVFAALAWKGREAMLVAGGMAMLLAFLAILLNPPPSELLVMVLCNRAAVSVVMGGAVLFAWWREGQQAQADALNERLAAIAQATNDAIWDYDVVKNELWWTQGHQVLFGSLPSSRIEGWYERIHPEDRERVVRGFRGAIEGSAQYWCDEYRYRRSNGSYADVLDRAEIRRHADGEGIRMVGGMSDLTAQKQAFRALQDAYKTLEVLSQKYRVLIDQTMTGVYLIQHDRFVFVNPRICTLLQRSAEALLALPSFSEIVAPEDRALVEQQMKNRLTGVEVSAHYVGRAVRPDGSLRWVEVYGTRIDFEGAPAILGVANDVTDRMQAEADSQRAHKELERLYRQYHTLVERAIVGIYIIRDERLLYVNPALCKLVGRTKEDILSQLSLLEHLFEQDRALSREEMRRRFSGELQANPYRVRVVRPDGSLVWLEVFGTIIEYEGQPAILGTAMDVTERLRAEEQQQRLLEELVAVRERLQALSQQLMHLQEEERKQIAQDLHDEIGQALTLLRADIVQVRRTVGQSDAVLSGRLDAGLTTTNSLIERVRGMSLDLRPAMLDDLGLPETIRWYVDRIAPRVGWTAEVLVDDALEDLPKPVALAAFRIIQESLTNVMRHATATRVLIKGELQDGTMHLLIRDNGKGFDVERALKRVSQGGSVGLLSMQERLRILGGEVSVQSTPGTETVVRIQIPLEVAV